MPVHTEISVARKYVKLEKLRLEQRLNVHWDIGSIPRIAKTPVLMLQMLLENAVHHGIERLESGGDIMVQVKMTDDETLSISVQNPIAKIEAAHDPADRTAEQDSSTLDNIRLRLNELYAGTARITVQQTDSQFSVWVIHPAFGDMYEDTSR